MSRPFTLAARTAYRASTPRLFCNANVSVTGGSAGPAARAGASTGARGLASGQPVSTACGHVALLSPTRTNVAGPAMANVLVSDPLRRRNARGIRTSAVALKDLYETLGVDKKASKSDIKKAYYELAKKYHPDANPGDETAAKKFAEISEAYETLGDDKAREMYDAGGGKHGQFQGFQGFGGGGSQAHHEDLFNQLHEMFGGGAFGGNRGGNGPRRGADVQTELQISFDEAVTGTTRTLRYRTRVPCEDCSGSGAADGTTPAACPVCQGSGVETMTMQGFLQYQTTCRKCEGEGTIITNPCGGCRGRGVQQTEREVKVDIPPGIDDNMDIRLLNQGHAGEKGGPPGSMYVRVRVARSKDFQRDGADVYSDVDVSLAQAVLGGTVYVKGIRGDVNLKVKPGTQSGQVTRLPDRGLPRVNNQNQRGHHYVEFRVRVPSDKELTPRQRQLMLEWAREEGTLGTNGTVNGLDDYIASAAAAAAASASGTAAGPASASADGKDGDDDAGWFDWLCKDDKAKKAKEKKSKMDKEGGDDDRAAEAK